MWKSFATFIVTTLVCVMVTVVWCVSVCVLNLAGTWCDSLSSVVSLLLQGCYSILLVWKPCPSKNMIWKVLDLTSLGDAMGFKPLPSKNYDAKSFEPSLHIIRWCMSRVSELENTKAHCQGVSTSNWTVLKTILWVQTQYLCDELKHGAIGAFTQFGNFS